MKGGLLKTNLVNLVPLILHPLHREELHKECMNPLAKVSKFVPVADVEVRLLRFVQDKLGIYTDELRRLLLEDGNSLFHQLLNLFLLPTVAFNQTTRDQDYLCMDKLRIKHAPDLLHLCRVAVAKKVKKLMTEEVEEKLKELRKEHPTREFSWEELIAFIWNLLKDEKIEIPLEDVCLDWVVAWPRRQLLPNGYASVSYDIGKNLEHAKSFVHRLQIMDEIYTMKGKPVLRFLQADLRILDFIKMDYWDIIPMTVQ